VGGSVKNYAQVTKKTTFQAIIKNAYVRIDGEPVFFAFTQSNADMLCAKFGYKNAITGRTGRYDSLQIGQAPVLVVENDQLIDLEMSLKHLL
jgi:hypothetical protein